MSSLKYNLLENVTEFTVFLWLLEYCVFMKDFKSNLKINVLHDYESITHLHLNNFHVEIYPCLIWPAIIHLR